MRVSLIQIRIVPESRERDDEPENAYRGFLCWLDQELAHSQRARTMTEALKRYTRHLINFRCRRISGASMTSTTGRDGLDAEALQYFANKT